MTSIWKALEGLNHISAVAAEWEALAGSQFSIFKSALLQPASEPARSYRCPRGCGCAHEIVRHPGGRIVAVCRCEPWNCEDLPLTEADVVLWKLNRAKLGRAIAGALKCEAKDSDLGLPGTRQIASLGSAPLPIVLTIQPNDASFSAVAAQLVAKLPKGFVLLAPTSRFCSASATEMMWPTP